MFYRLDEWIVSRFEGFSHWTQRNFGVNSRHWAQTASLVSALFIVKLFFDKTPSLGLKMMLSVQLLALFLRFMRYGTESTRDQDSDGSEATMNPRKKKDRNWRLAGLVISVICTWADNGAHDYWFQFSTIAFYFEACDDLPGGKSKLRAWLESLRPSPLSAPAASE